VCQNQFIDRLLILYGGEQLYPRISAAEQHNAFADHDDVKITVPAKITRGQDTNRGIAVIRLGVDSPPEKHHYSIDGTYYHEQHEYHSDQVPDAECGNLTVIQGG
jgi:hypothetical protein